jgi:hypothetical protein
MYTICFDCHATPDHEYADTVLDHNFANPMWERFFAAFPAPRAAIGSKLVHFCFVRSHSLPSHPWWSNFYVDWRTWDESDGVSLTRERLFCFRRGTQFPSGNALQTDLAPMIRHESRASLAKTCEVVSQFSDLRYLARSFVFRSQKELTYSILYTVSDKIVSMFFLMPYLRWYSHHYNLNLCVL